MTIDSFAPNLPARLVTTQADSKVQTLIATLGSFTQQVSSPSNPYIWWPNRCSPLNSNHILWSTLTPQRLTYYRLAINNKILTVENIHKRRWTTRIIVFSVTLYYSSTILHLEYSQINLHLYHKFSSLYVHGCSRSTRSLMNEIHGVITQSFNLNGIVLCKQSPGSLVGAQCTELHSKQQKI